jgi:hypothetical protein
MGERVKIARRHLMLAAAVAGCATVVAAGVLARGTGRASSASQPSFTFEMTGKVVHLTQRQARRLSGAPTSGSLSLLAIRDGRAFYRLGDARAHCYAVGDARSVGTVGAVGCWEDSEPLMDFSVVDLSSGSPSEVKFFRIEGIAADQVSSVGVLGPNGDIVARVPVVRNVYAASAPPGAPGRGLVAFDDRGRPLATLPGS